MDDPAAIREMIRAAAEGTSAGIEVLKAAGLEVSLEDFAVEVRYDTATTTGASIQVQVTERR